MEGSTRFEILGPLAAFHGSVPVAIAGRRRRALLAIFLLNPNTELAAGRLIDLLWEGQPPDGAPNTLQVHVSNLRRLLAPGHSGSPADRLIVTRPSGYALDIGRDRVDALVFEDGLASGRAALAAHDHPTAWTVLGSALALWHGPALADLADEMFALPAAARLDELRMEAYRARAEAGLALGRHEELVADLDRVVAEHPLREEFTASLMLALYRCGRQADALAAYQRLREELADSLGLQPGAELQQLEDAILLQKPELDWNPQTSEIARPVLRLGHSAPISPSSSLVGRRRERTRLDEVFHLSWGGATRTVLLAGEPGIGKTRLVTELAEHASAAGATVLTGNCYEEVLLPYQPIVEALTPLIRDLSLDDLRSRLGPAYHALSTFLPGLVGGPLQVSDRGDRFEQFEAVSTLLREAARDAPVMLVVEDLHWADRPTVLLLDYLVRTTVGERMLVVGTFRDTDLAPEHPLANPDGSLRRAAEVLELHGLGSDDVAELVRVRTGTQVAAGITDVLQQRTGGNPLFVEEVLRHLAESERDLDEHAVTSAIPHGIRAVISRRIGRLSGETRRVLSIAAIVGSEFELQLVAASAGMRADRLADALDEALRSRIITDFGDGRSAFTHALLAESVLADLGPARRASLHGAVALALEAMAGSDTRSRSGELADHFARSGDATSLSRAWRYSWEAARRASALQAPEEAVRRYHDALRLLDQAGDGDDAARCDLALELGEAAFHAGDRVASKAAFASATEVAIADGDPERLARVALGTSGWGLQDLWVDYGYVNSATVTLLEDALSGIGGQDCVLRARLLARLAEELHFAEGDSRRAELADEAVLMARRLDDPHTLALTLHGRLRALEGPDALAGRLADAADMLKAAERAGVRDLRCVAHGRSVPGLMEAGRFAEADRHIAAHSHLADELHSPLHRIWSCGMCAARALMCGDFERVEQLIGEAATISAEQFAAVQAFAGMLCVLRVEQGRAAEMVDVGRQFVAEFPHVPAWRAGFAVLLAESGAAGEARAEIDIVLADGLGRVRRDQNWAFCMAALGEACSTLDDGSRAAPVYEELQPFSERFIVLGDGFAVWCAVSKSLGILARACGRLEEAQRHLEHALSAHRAAGARALTSRTMAELGRVLLISGDERAGTRLTEQAIASATEIGQAGVVRAFS